MTCCTFASPFYAHVLRLKRAGRVAAIDPSLDWSANFSRMLGFEGKDVAELLRLYLSIHACVAFISVALPLLLSA